MFYRIGHSLSAKLLLLFICGGIILLLLVGSIIGKGLTNNLISHTSPFLLHYARMLQQQDGEAPTLDSAIQLSKHDHVDIHYLSNNETWSTAESVPNKIQLEALSEPGIWDIELDQNNKIKTIDGKLVLITQGPGYHLYFQIPQPKAIGITTVFEYAILGLILATLLLIFYAAKSLIKPIEDIQDGVKLIGRGNLDHRIVKRRDDELGDLADEVNTMADDIQGMLEAKRQMLLGISHELRSPITRSRVHLALMENSSSREEIEKDMIAMEGMISELLDSEKLSSRHVSLNREKVKLDLLIKEFVYKEFSGKVKVMELANIWANVDQSRIKLLLRNMLQNAIKHSGNRKRRPTISLVAEIDEFCVYVSDRGSGIDPSHIPFLTEPFYRADPSRQRKTGGFGLGLHLCKAIVEAHGGELSITSEPKLGTTIRCAFPHVEFSI